MKTRLSLITFLLFSINSLAQLKGDYGIWARTPISLEKKQFQFEYALEQVNYNNVLKGWWYTGDSSISHEGDYTFYSYLGFNVRYGISDRLEASVENIHVENSEFFPRVFDKYNFGLPALQLKYQVNKTPIYKTHAAVVIGSTFNLFKVLDDTYPFTNYHNLGVRLQTRLNNNLLLRYGTTVHYYYLPPDLWRKGSYTTKLDFHINTQYSLKDKGGFFAEYALNSIWYRQYQLGGFYNINESTQLMGAYYYDLIVKNDFTLSAFKFGIFKNLYNKVKNNPN